VRVELSIDSDTYNIVDVLFSLLLVKIVVYVVSVNAVTC
jgi:hypothetical protein